MHHINFTLRFSGAVSPYSSSPGAGFRAGYIVFTETAGLEKPIRAGRPGVELTSFDLGHVVVAHRAKDTVSFPDGVFRDWRALPRVPFGTVCPPRGGGAGIQTRSVNNRHAHRHREGVQGM